MTFAGRLLSALAAALVLAGSAGASTITSVGAVTALTHGSQMGAALGTASFDTLTANTVIAADAYAASGATFHSGPLGSILAGVTALGTAVLPSVVAYPGYFPAPIGGGGTVGGNYLFHGGVLTFSQTVTQFGLVFSTNGTQYITAWDMAGGLIGQVRWVPDGAASFVGIDTGGVAIGMLSIGNDDVHGGVAYGIGGSTIIADSYAWSDGSATVPLPAGLPLLGGALAAAALLRRRGSTRG
ncbi:hypothetical protein [Poseidonocella sp. HB161398]|uniref:hypothetical protein n=1 Tax=Poseidonocella sp. HB161398 TaxID=2320855 RepID=UPI001107EF7C|nr:hypothetical protein [Poseidonocella sp. HB161398]